MGVVWEDSGSRVGIFTTPATIRPSRRRRRRKRKEREKTSISDDATSTLDERRS
jgi:hypothetical protein